MKHLTIFLISFTLLVLACGPGGRVRPTSIVAPNSTQPVPALSHTPTGVIALPTPTASGPSCQFAEAFTEYPQGSPFERGGELFRGWDPFVIYDNDGFYKVWYTLWANQTLGIAYAESEDGLTWPPRADSSPVHVLTPTPGAWDEQGIETVSVLKKDGRYYLWYLGYPCTRPAGERGRHKCIGLATSEDGVHWQKHPEPVLEPTQPWERPYLRTYVEKGKEFQAWEGGVQEPTVLWDAPQQLFKMWYNGFTLEEVTFVENGEQITREVRLRQIGYATSPDGLHWTKYPGNPVFTPLRNGTTWEEPFAVDHTNVIADPVQGYHLFYFSWYSIGHAYSADGVHWERNPNNPLVAGRVSDEQFLAFGGPSALLEGDTLRLYLMRSKPGAKQWGDGGMTLGLAIGTCQQE